MDCGVGVSGIFFVTLSNHAADVPTLKITSTGEGVVTINDTTYVVDQSPLASLLCVPDISSPTDKVEWSIVSTSEAQTSNTTPIIIQEIPLSSI